MGGSGHTETCQFEACDHYRDAAEHLQHFVSHVNMSQVAMLYIDSKVGEVPGELMDRATENLIDLLENEVLMKGYKGIVLIGGPDKNYLELAAKHSSNSKFTSQIYLAHDAINNFDERMKVMAELNYPNKMISAGIARVAKKHTTYDEEAIVGRINKARGVIADIVIWTVQSVEEYDYYFKYGARGMITNNIRQMVDWAKNNNYEMYKQGDVICSTPLTATNEDQVVTDPGECDCSKSGRGCRVVKPVQLSGSACRCKKWSFGWFSGCQGDVVGCKDLKSPKCRHPDKSRRSCLQGAGDCHGY